MCFCSTGAEWSLSASFCLARLQILVRGAFLEFLGSMLLALPAGQYLRLREYRKQNENLRIHRVHSVLSRLPSVLSLSVCFISCPEISALILKENNREKYIIQFYKYGSLSS